MERICVIGNCTVSADPEATGAWYAASEGWDCPCGHCRNFIALARARRLPEHVLELLDLLGIPPEKPTYLCSMDEGPGGLLYDFSWRVNGTILSGASGGDDPVRCFRETYPFDAPGFPEPWFDMGFFLRLPWVLEEPIGGVPDNNT